MNKACCRRKGSFRLRVPEGESIPIGGGVANSRGRKLRDYICSHELEEEVQKRARL